MLNAGEAYHRGGFCKSEMRILGRFIYSGFGDKRDNLINYGVSQSYLAKIASKLSRKFYDLHEKVYRNLKKISFEGIFFRKDIGHQVRAKYKRSPN